MKTNPRDLAAVQATASNWLALLEDAVPALSVLADLERAIKDAEQRRDAAEAKAAELDRLTRSCSEKQAELNRTNAALAQATADCAALRAKLDGG